MTHNDATRKIKGREIYIPPVSHYSTHKEWERAAWEILTQSPHILDALMSPYERRILVMRAAIVHRVHLGKSYREIGDELWCAPQTVSSIKKSLKERQYRSYWQRGKTERRRYPSFSRAPGSEPHTRIVNMSFKDTGAMRHHSTRGMTKRR